MLDPAVNFFEKLVSEFTWKRLFFITVVFMLSTVVLWTYESYTRNFTLTRLERSAELVEKLAKLSDNPSVSKNDDLQSAHAGLTSQLDKLVNSENETEIMHPRLRQGLFATLPWLVLSICMMLASSASDGSKTNTLFGVSIVAVPIVAILTILPIYELTWINDWILPWSAMVIVMAIIMFVWGGKDKKS